MGWGLSKPRVESTHASYDFEMYDLLCLFFGVWHMEDAKMVSVFRGLEPSPGIWKMLRCTICCLCFFGVWHMEDAKMYDLLSLFWPLPLAYWKVKLRSCCSAYWGVNPALAYGRF